MIDNAPLADAVLITLDSKNARVLGKSVQERQLEQALALGCGKLILLGGGAQAEAISLRHQAEAANAKVLVISGSHALVNCIAADEKLLVLQPGLLIADGGALDVLRGDGGVLVLPSGAGVEAGFERIDLARAWAGALVLTGDRLNGLLDLPEDSDPNAALLRIALQMGEGEHPLPESMLNNGSWIMLADRSAVSLAEGHWLTRQLPEVSAFAPTMRLSNAVLRVMGRTLLAHGGLGKGLIASALLLLAGAIFAGYFLHAALAFALIALAVAIMEVSLGLIALKAVPFPPPKHLSKLRFLADLTIATAAILVNQGEWAQQFFAPLVLLGLLLLGQEKRRFSTSLVHDRTILCLVMALICIVQPAQLAIMAAALLLLLANLIQRSRKST